MNDIFRIEDVSFSYNGRNVLDGISLTLARGSFNTIVGPNASGKTTLLKLMQRILSAKHGVVMLNDFDIRHYRHKDIAKIIGSVPQSTGIESDFTVYDIVLMGRYPHQSRFQDESKEDAEVVRRSMEAAEVWHLKDKHVNRLSGGESQRVVVARALAQEPEVLLLDEPTSHLDIHHQIELLSMVRFLSQEHGLTVVTVLHELNFALHYSDTIILLHQGRIYAQGVPQQVLTEAVIKEVYGIEAFIIAHPGSGKPVIIPVMDKG